MSFLSFLNQLSSCLQSIYVHSLIVKRKNHCLHRLQLYYLPISFATNRPILYSKLTICWQKVINKPWVSSWKETETTNGQVKKIRPENMLLFSTLKLLNKQLTIGFDRDKFRAINSVTTTAKHAGGQDQNHCFHVSSTTFNFI